MMVNIELWFVLITVSFSSYWISMYLEGLGLGAPRFGIYELHSILLILVGISFWFLSLFIPTNTTLNFNSMTTRDIVIINLAVIFFFSWFLGGGYIVAKTIELKSNKKYETMLLLILPISWIIVIFPILIITAYQYRFYNRENIEYLLLTVLIFCAGYEAIKTVNME